MLRFWVASTGPERAAERRLSSLGEVEGRLWRRVIAGQKQACCRLERTN